MLENPLADFFDEGVVELWLFGLQLLDSFAGLCLGDYPVDWRLVVWSSVA